MSDGAWLKFRYYRAVFAEPGFSLADKAVLGFAAVELVHGSGDTFCRRQDTVANRVGINTRTIQRAYKRAIELGYLELVSERHRGSRGRADEYRILIPEVGSQSLHTSDEVPDTVSPTSLGYPTHSPKVPDIQSKVGDIESAKITSTSSDEAPKVSIEGLLGKGAAQPHPAPLLDHLGQPRCRKHFGVENPPDCPPCGLERERKEAIDKAEAERVEAERRAIRAAIDSCPNKCDDAGRLDDLSDCPLHPNFRQKRDVA
ncbi:hypothetical protein [Mycobacteroides abscessus]|uniref:hypothetical protein n=1 Tax=Mycobacteroides abscessus TaxID=36809 RepID=UPI000E687EA8|nr:hypothetical protein [Mycobacteroides abscessus]RIS87879.1 hypothetical protein D2E44_05195 [Mycobacteroides abscessus]